MIGCSEKKRENYPKAVHAKITEGVCHYTRKTVMCASAVMGSLECTVSKVNNYDKRHLSCLSNSLDSNTEFGTTPLIKHSV